MTALPYSQDNPMRVVLAGFGNVGRTLAPRLAAGDIPKVRLTAIAARDLEKARRGVAELGLSPAPPVVPLADLPRHADVIVECATFDAFPEIARVALGAGKTLLAVSAGALSVHSDLVELAERHGAVIHIASGAMPGLDIVRSAREGGIRSVRLSSRLRPEAVAKEPYVIGKGFDFSAAPPAPVRVFDGTAREAAQAFPRHYNVAVALSLAGIGLDDTEVEVWVDGAIPGPVHHVEVDAEAAGITMETRNRPSPNRNTSRLVAPSILAALRAMVSPLRLGS